MDRLVHHFELRKVSDCLHGFYNNIGFGNVNDRGVNGFIYSLILNYSYFQNADIVKVEQGLNCYC